MIKIMLLVPKIFQERRYVEVFVRHLGFQINIIMSSFYKVIYKQAH